MEVKNVTKSYNKKQILKNISFEAENGSCVGILGVNGSGKSTLLNILAGVIPCDQGSFVYNGKNLFSDSKLRSSVVGYVPQNSPLFEELTALDNLRLWYTRKEIKEELSNGVLKLLGIDEFAKKVVFKMSGGMKKRLSIGCAVAHKPKILLLDEPSAALDLVCKESVSKYIQSYKNSGGTVIIATHDIGELSLCDKLYIIKNGSLCEYFYDGNVEKLICELKL